MVPVYVVDIWQCVINASSLLLLNCHGHCTDLTRYGIGSSFGINGGYEILCLRRSIVDGSSNCHLALLVYEAMALSLWGSLRAREFVAFEIVVPARHSQGGSMEVVVRWILSEWT